MSSDKYHRIAAVDMLTLVICFPLALWIGWWGVALAFAIGTAINCWASKHEARAAAPSTDKPTEPA